MQISIVTIDGKEILKQEVSVHEKKDIQINTESMQAGLYYVRIVSEGVDGSLPVIIMK